MCESKHSVVQGSSLSHVLRIELTVGQLTEASPLKVRLYQTEGTAVASNELQGLSDAIHLSPHCDYR